MKCKKKETLHYLAMSSSTTAVDAARRILEQGENPNTVDKDGLTPLHYACGHDNVAMCQLLITFGADPKCCDKLGRTPLSVAKGNSLRFLRRFQKKDTNQKMGFFKRFFACHNPHNDTFFIRRPNGRSEGPVINSNSLTISRNFHRDNTFSRSYRNAKKKIRATFNVIRRRNSSVELQDTVMTSEGIRTINTPTRPEKNHQLRCKKSLSLESLNVQRSVPQKRSKSEEEKWKTPRRKQVTPTAPPIDMYESTSEEDDERSDKNKEKTRRKTSGQNTTAYFTADESLELVLDAKMSKMTISEPNTPTHVDNGEMRKIKRLRDAELKKELKKFGISPAGQFDVKTRRLYEKKLLSEKMKIIERGYCPDEDVSKLKYSSQLENVLKIGKLSNDLIERARKSDEAIREEFSADGFGYTAFCYLILDPRISGNNVDSLNLQQFVESIFYVGKGSKNRPLAHFIDARNARKEKSEKLKTNEKLRTIDELWTLGHAIPRHELFHGIGDEEAYVREACLIEALSVNNLSNKKAGELHGKAKNWDSITRAEYGVFLLNNALSSLKLEGFRYVVENKLPEQLYPFVNDNRRTPRTPK